MKNIRDFGKIALIVNQFGGLKKGEVYITNSSALKILYGSMHQTLDPHELSKVLMVTKGEYADELDGLIVKRHKDDSPSWRERNLKSYMSFLHEAIHLLNELSTFLKETEED